LTDGDQVVDGNNCGSDTNTVKPYEFDPASIGLQGNKLSTTGPTNSSFAPYGYLVDSAPYNQGISSTTEEDVELDRLTLEACDEAKAQGAGQRAIEIYAIAAGSSAGPGTRAHDVLSNSASTNSHMYFAEGDTDMEAVFGAIGERAVALRLSD